jgi:hypothetical protein
MLLVDAREGKEQRLRVAKIIIAVLTPLLSQEVRWRRTRLFNCIAKKFHDCVGTLKEALALYRRALPSNHQSILITITNVDSAFSHIVSRHVEAGDYRGALNAASDALQFLKNNLPSNDVMVSPRLSF